MVMCYAPEIKISIWSGDPPRIHPMATGSTSNYTGAIFEELVIAPGSNGAVTTDVNLCSGMRHDISQA